MKLLIFFVMTGFLACGEAIYDPEGCRKTIKECEESYYEETEKTTSDKKSHYQCLMRATGCSGEDALKRDEAADKILKEIKEECPDCPDPEPAGPMMMTADFTNTQVKPCVQLLAECVSQFDNRFTDQQALQEYYNCLIAPQGCDESDKKQRKALLDILDQLCPDCKAKGTEPNHEPNSEPNPEPNPEPNAEPNAEPEPEPGLESEHCITKIVDCSNPHKEQNLDYEQLKEYHQCIAAAENCQGLYLEQQQQMLGDLETLLEMACPGCDHFGDGPPTCIQAVQICQKEFDESDQTPKELHAYFHCMYEPTDCATWENELRDNITRQVAAGCQWCVPESILERVMCPSYIETCLQTYKASSSEMTEATTFYNCLDKLRNCTGDAEVHRQRLISDVQSSCPACVPSNATTNVKADCTMPVNECWKAFNESSKQSADMLFAYNCLTDIHNCSGQPEALRQGLMGNIKKYCPACGQSPSPAPPASGPTCGQHINECYGVFNRSKKNSEGMKTFYHCLEQSKDCNSNDEAVRKELQEKILAACSDCDTPLPTKMPPGMSCSEYITKCYTTYESGEKELWDLKVFYFCLKYPDNCSSGEEAIRQSTLKDVLQGISLLCPDCDMESMNGLPSTTPAPANTCFGYLSDCRTSYDASGRNYSDAKRWYDCLALVTNCDIWEENYKELSLEEAFAAMKKNCPSCHTDPHTTRAPGMGGVTPSCMDWIEHCRKTFEQTHGNEHDLMEYDSCIWTPYECKPGEERMRMKLTKAIEKALKNLSHDWMPRVGAASPLRTHTATVLVVMTTIMLTLV